jgi:hypothetical protein
MKLWETGRPAKSFAVRTITKIQQAVHFKNELHSIFSGVSLHPIQFSYSTMTQKYKTI